MSTSRVLGVDVGTVRIGLALSDVERMVATPMKTISGRDQQAAIAEIQAVIEAHDIETMVVGLPIDLDGTEGRAAKRTRRFVARLEERLNLDAQWLDERLTSAQAERVLLSANVRRNKRKEVVDQMAAALILQAWLDTH